MTKVSNFTNIRVVFLGSFFCGKTNLANSLTNKRYVVEYTPTIGIDYFVKNNKYNKLHIWDTAGITRFRSLLLSYVQNSDVLCFCFENNNLPSLKQMIEIYHHFSWKCNYLEKKIIIVKTKCDIINNDNIFTETKLDDFNIYNYPIISTSSMRKSGLEELNNTIGEKLFNIEKKEKRCCF